VDFITISKLIVNKCDEQTSHSTMHMGFLGFLGLLGV
jgi:hypothetical protein